MIAANRQMAHKTHSGPRSLYFSIGGPAVAMPTRVTTAESPKSMMANSRGAVPGPKAKPRCPGSSADAISAKVASIISTRPP